MRERIIIRIVPEGEDFILFFPDEVADDSGNVVSYMTIGGHGAAPCQRGSLQMIAANANKP